MAGIEEQTGECVDPEYTAVTLLHEFLKAKKMEKHVDHDGRSLTSLLFANGFSSSPKPSSPEGGVQAAKRDVHVDSNMGRSSHPRERNHVAASARASRSRSATLSGLRPRLTPSVTAFGWRRVEITSGRRQTATKEK